MQDSDVSYPELSSSSPQGCRPHCLALVWTTLSTSPPADRCAAVQRYGTSPLAWCSTRSLTLERQSVRPSANTLEPVGENIETFVTALNLLHEKWFFNNASFWNISNQVQNIIQRWSIFIEFYWIHFRWIQRIQDQICFDADIKIK